MSFTGVAFAYASRDGHLALETGASVVALFAGALVMTRFRQGAGLDDLVLAVGLLILAGSNLFFAVLPEVVSGVPDVRWTWARAAGDLVGAGAFAASAFLPARPLPRPRVAERRALSATAGLLG